MKVRYLYSASVVIETASCKILCDPWFTPNYAYYGAWAQYPVLPNPIETIGPVDYIYVSHVHPDHYDPEFLRAYRAAYPDAKIIVSQPHLEKALARAALPFHRQSIITHGGTTMTIVRNQNDPLNIDTALSVCEGSQCVLNLNDNVPSNWQLTQLPYEENMLALLPYSGAGPWPQTYCLGNMAEEAEKKKRGMFGMFQNYVENLQPTWIIPFAGKYWLKGELARMNPDRGVPDALEAAALYTNAVVLADGGHATFDLDTGQASAVRTEPYPVEEIQKQMLAKPTEYPWSHDPMPDHKDVIALLDRAFWDTCSVYHPGIVPTWTTLESLGIIAGSTLWSCSPFEGKLGPRLPLPAWIISIDPRFLVGLLTGKYLWNNAEIGSLFTSTLVKALQAPNIDREETGLYTWLLQFRVRG